MPTFRHRTQSTTGHTGHRTLISTGVSTSLTVGGIHNACDDIVGNMPNPNGLLIEKTSLGAGTISGRSTSFPVYDWDEYPYTNQPSASLPAGWDSGMPGLVASVTQVAARTNPGRADISVPVFLAELKDLPGMIKKNGDNDRYLKAVGRYKPKGKTSNSVAEEHFGWTPLFRDIGSLLDFTALVDKRMKELRSLYSKRGLRRNKKVWANGFTTTQFVVPFNTVEASVYGDRSTSVVARRWASIRWRPTLPPPYMPTNEDLLQKARFAVHGWRINPSDAWELIPWSWLADYFLNVGDMLETYGNAWEYHCEDGCVMTSVTVTVRDDPFAVSGGFTAIPGVATYTLKLRELASPGLSIFGHILSPKQLTNLAGIAANYGGLKK
ncbi:maturation protein [ssRNA phage Zoerhiza.4_25]|uniref:Maturation protein n=2 Tax=Leviviricetes TaxID=2842243 RepID=A0A8S5L0U3_9VIRU|nr:maturation protein [ssRNA phage Zoerhiza.4_25]QDH90344.1 MAG: hypothetical protein H4Rhizo45440_000003 [Leviviridae sp.]DAD51526.1 TPA_asm: maturation protein [ssRNA phage Zoerhiza.4_25]